MIWNNTGGSGSLDAFVHENTVSDTAAVGEVEFQSTIPSSESDVGKKLSQDGTPKHSLRREILEKSFVSSITSQTTSQTMTCTQEKNHSS